MEVVASACEAGAPSPSTSERMLDRNFGACALRCGMSTLPKGLSTGPDSAGGSPSQLEVGLLHALSLMDHVNPRLMVTISGRAVLDNVTGKLGRVLPPMAIKRLLVDRQKDWSIKVVADSDQPLFFWPGPVLLIYPTAKALSRVGQIAQVTAEVVVPWEGANKDITLWASTWAPLPIGSATPAQPIRVLSRVAEVAIRSLATLVNINNGMRDRERSDTIRVFETLLAFEKQPLDRTAVRACLVRDGKWPGDMADAAIDILNDLARGKAIRGRTGPNRDNYEYWCKTASESDTPPSTTA